MKLLLSVLAVAMGTFAFASDGCFNAPDVVRLVDFSDALKHCYDDNDRECNLTQKSIEDQVDINANRLVPADRSKDPFLDRATGRVTVAFGRYPGPDSNKIYRASAMKISRCHVMTSAHLIYTDGFLPLTSEAFDLQFSYGQSCTARDPFRERVRASVAFKMTDPKKGDFDCGPGNRTADCAERYFKGHSDLIILRLTTYDRSDRRFFNLVTTDPNMLRLGERVDCWSYPEHIDDLGLPEDRSQLFLWRQERAQVFGDNDGELHKGTMTNAVSYKGMSGGGCALSSASSMLVGLFANDNKRDGKPAVAITPDRIRSHKPNYLASFHKLRARYEAETGKRLSKIDEECE
jgi:hypothetical protein